MKQLIIILGIHWIVFADFIDSELADNYYEILRLIFNRGELDLAQIGIYSNLASTKSASKSLIDSKKKLGTKFQYLIYTWLRYSIEKLNRKSVDFYKRDFVVCAVALGFFKIPEFRSAFIKAITKEPFLEIPEWRGILFSLEENDKENENAVNEFFDWNEYLYSKIPDNTDKKKNLEILANILTMHHWENKIEKRGVAFFLIIAKWADYVKTTIVTGKNIEWKSIPGYLTMVRAVFSEMKALPVNEYPESLVEATTSLLVNGKLLYVMVEIIFKKTNIFNPNDVKRTLEITERWFRVFEDERKFPANLDFNFFFRAIEMLIDHEHAISTPKWIW